jgi:AAA+ superfamily predicted ATPase
MSDPHPWEVAADEWLRAAVVARGAVGDDLAEQAAAMGSFRSADRRRAKAAGVVTGLLAAALDADERFRDIVTAVPAEETLVAEAVALLAAVEVDTARRRVVTGLGGRPDGTVTLGMIGDVAPHLLGLLADDGALVISCVAEVGDERPWARRTVALAPPVVWHLLHGSTVDDELPADLDEIHVPEVATGARVAAVSGPDALSRQRRALEVLGGGRAVVLTVSTTVERTASGDDRRVDDIPDAAVWRAVVRAATVRRAAVIVDLPGALPSVCRRWVQRATHLRWGITSAAELPITEMPDGEWVDASVTDRLAPHEEVVRRLGGAVDPGHRFSPTQLEQVRRVLPALGGDPARATRRLVTGELDRLATRIVPRRTWDDLVLRPGDLERVRMVAARYRHRQRVFEDWSFGATPSAGVVAMFSGPPGTGKTLSAEVIAADLGLDLFKINLATMVSKYIGETEKNLERLFAAADTGNVVLLFDEADSIFGKRSEVSDAQDRYANLEVSYLLERIERFDGLVVLTTNLMSNIDAAFTRRIHVTVDFPSPDADERRRLWERALPADAPIGEVDLDFCIGMKMTGADIRAVSLGAAFRAAAAGEPIGMAHIVPAMADEFRKQGRLVDPASFGRYRSMLDGPA